MLRDPKDVVKSMQERGPLSEVAGEFVVSSTTKAIEAIRARDREVIAEAKRVLIDEHGGHGDDAPTCCDTCAHLWRKVRECVAALDDILKET